MGNTIIAIVCVYRGYQAHRLLQLSDNVVEKDLVKSPITCKTIPLTVHLLWHHLILSHVCQHAHTIGCLVGHVEISPNQ